MFLHYISSHCCSNLVPRETVRSSAQVGLRQTRQTTRTRGRSLRRITRTRGRSLRRGTRARGRLLLLLMQPLGHLRIPANTGVLQHLECFAAAIAIAIAPELGETHAGADHLDQLHGRREFEIQANKHGEGNDLCEKITHRTVVLLYDEHCLSMLHTLCDKYLKIAHLLTYQ